MDLPGRRKMDELSAAGRVGANLTGGAGAGPLVAPAQMYQQVRSESHG